MEAARPVDAAVEAEWLTGRPTDFMTVHHLILSGNQTEIGCGHFLLFERGPLAAPEQPSRENLGFNDSCRRSRVLVDGVRTDHLGSAQLWDLLETVRADRSQDE